MLWNWCPAILPKMDRGAQQAHRIIKSQTKLKRLSIQVCKDACIFHRLLDTKKNHNIYPKWHSARGKESIQNLWLLLLNSTPQVIYIFNFFPICFVLDTFHLLLYLHCFHFASYSSPGRLTKSGHVAGILSSGFLLCSPTGGHWKERRKRRLARDWLYPSKEWGSSPEFALCTQLFLSLGSSTHCFLLSCLQVVTLHYPLVPTPLPCKSWWVWSDTDIYTLLLLSHFSHVQLLVTPWTAAHLAPPSMWFSRQEYWSGLPFPSPHIRTTVSKIDNQRGCTI